MQNSRSMALQTINFDSHMLEPTSKPSDQRQRSTSKPAKDLVSKQATFGDSNSLFNIRQLQSNSKAFACIIQKPLDISSLKSLEAKWKSPLLLRQAATKRNTVTSLSRLSDFKTKSSPHNQNQVILLPLEKPPASSHSSMLIRQEIDKKPKAMPKPPISTAQTS